MHLLLATFSLAALLLLPSPRPACAQSLDGDALIRDEQLLRPGRPGRLKPSSPEAARAARTAVHYLNSHPGSPSSVREPAHVKTASVKRIPGLGRKYFLRFSTKDLNGQYVGTCEAQVFYWTKKPEPQVIIDCPNQDEAAQRLKDYALYQSLQDALDGEKASFLLQALGSIGSSYIAWEKATEDESYFTTDMTSKKAWERDGSLVYDYKAVLQNDFSQLLSCQVRLNWKPEYPVKVKYDCHPDVGSADGSDEIGSGSGFFPELENNF